MIISPNSDWTTTNSRPVSSLLAWESQSQLHASTSDFITHRSFPVGHVHSSLRSNNGTLIRYVCQTATGKTDFSQIRSFYPDTGKSKMLCNLRLNQWASWISSPLNDQTIAAAIATTLNKDKVNIRYQLAFISLDGKNKDTVSLHNDAIRPLAHSGMRREIFFRGMLGLYRTGFDGRKIQSLLPLNNEMPGGIGADYHADRPVLAIGGNGIHLLDLKSRRCRKLCKTGVYPTWDATGEYIWYFESSSELKRIHVESGESESIIKIEQPGRNDAAILHPCTLSHCGRYLALKLSHKRRRTPAEMRDLLKHPARRDEDLFMRIEYLCILDTERREFWHREQRADNICWL